MIVSLFVDDNFKRLRERERHDEDIQRRLLRPVTVSSVKPSSTFPA
jgi:hypothetical protein